MKTYSPFQGLLRQIERSDKEHELRKARRAQRSENYLGSAASRIAYTSSQHHYQMTINGKPEGEPVVMTGAEAKAQNEIFSQRFKDELNAAIDSGKPFGCTGAVNRKWKWLKDFEPTAT